MNSEKLKLPLSCKTLLQNSKVVVYYTVTLSVDASPLGL